MAKKKSHKHITDVASFLSAKATGEPLSRLSGRILGDLCAKVNPDCVDLCQREFGPIFLEIISHLTIYLKSLPPVVAINHVVSSSDEYRSLSSKTVQYLRDNKLGSDAVVTMCRLLGHHILQEIYDAGIDDEIGRARVQVFFAEFESSLVQLWAHEEIHHHQKQLREANRYILLEKRRYYTIFSRMIEPAFIIDSNMHIVDSNMAFNAFFGIQDKNHLGRLCYDVMGEEICAACALEEMIGSQKSFSGIEAVIPVQGEKKAVIFSGTFLGDINSEFTGGIISIQDITYSKETEKALLESEEKYRTLVENIPDVTWRSDQNGNIVYMSPNIEKVCGYQPGEIIAAGENGRYDKIHPRDVDRVRNDFALFFASHLPSGGFVRNLLREEKALTDDKLIIDGQKKYDVKYRFQKKDGSWIWIHDRASTICNINGVWYTDGVFSDISELKRAEDELEKHHFRMAEVIDERTAELRHANKMLEKEVMIRAQAEKELLALTARLKTSNQELEQFAHIASHDIKEPLILVLAFSERLLNKYSNDLDSKGREYLVRLAKAAEQMKCLVDDLFELSRLSTTTFSVEMINLTSLVDEVVQSLEERIHLAGGKVDVARLGFLDGDPTQLKQLFQNIIVNALKYSKGTKPPSVEIKQGLSDEQFVEIIIEDNGIGFDPSQVDHIFKPFARLHAGTEYDGTGIGLATCKKIVLRHGGEITAKSAPGEGASFIVRLPVKGHPRM